MESNQPTSKKLHFFCGLPQIDHGVSWYNYGFPTVRRAISHLTLLGYEEVNITRRLV